MDGECVIKSMPWMVLESFFSAKLDEMKPIVKILHFDEQRTNLMPGHAKYQNDKH